MKTIRTLILILLAALLLAACQSTTTPTVAPTAFEPSPTPIPPTPTPTPRELTICIGQEPQTLYRYGSPARSMWTVLEAVYDGPIDTVGYRPQPVILSELPTLANGGARYQPVTVKSGDEVIDANGELITLQVGSQVLPAGCTTANCAVTYDGATEVQMDQLMVDFKLLPGLQWSDGEPLNADDSLYSYEVALDPATPISRRLLDRTANYTMLDDLTTQWLGKPGFRSSAYSSFFFAPLPRHAWGDIPAAELLTSEASSRKPLGWGPYVVDEWVTGDHISLSKNPNYARAAEGLPAFDRLNFRFMGETSDANLNTLLAGECDLVDETALLEDHPERLQELVSRELIQVFSGQGPEWEKMDFGIKLAAYDAGYNIFGDYRPDIFSDVRVRQAFAQCLDRAGFAQQLYQGLGSAADGFLPPDHPDFAAGSTWAYDPQAGSALLEQAGWVDSDGDPATPRVAQGIVTVLPDTPLSVEYLTTDAPERMAAAQFLTESAKACGIELKPVAVASAELYAAGPEGKLFGRNFDLAQFSWQASGSSPCHLYTTEQIPGAENHWLGVNVSGYSNPEFDAACAEVMNSTPEDGEVYSSAQAQVQQIFTRDLPSVPLYFRLRTVAARTDLCNFELDLSARSELWNIEELNYGEGCQ